MPNGIRVLLIEDNRIEARQTQQWLTTGHPGEFEVQWAEQLSVGLKLLEEREFDLILLDLNLPDSRGFDTFHRVHEQFPQVPLVVLTGQDDEELGANAVAQGAQDYLIKHEISAAKLARVIRYALARHRAMLEAIVHSQGMSGRVLAFLGAKGGVGTTTLALNAAVALAMQRRSVILAEIRPSHGSLSYHLQQRPPRGLHSLLTLPLEKITPSELGKVLCKGPADLRVLFGPQSGEEFLPLETSWAESIVKTLTTMADFVILDLPSVFTGGTQGVVPLCHFIALVTEREPCSIASAKVACTQLQNWKVGGHLVGTIVVNRTIYPMSPDFQRIRSEIGSEIVGIVPSAPAVCLKAQEDGVPLVLSQPQQDISISLSEITKNLAGDNVVTLKL